MKTKHLRGWAVWNTELECPCVETNKDGDILASAIFIDDLHRPRARAIGWMKKNFPDRKKFKEVKLKRVEIRLV